MEPCRVSLSVLHVIAGLENGQVVRRFCSNPFGPRRFVYGTATVAQQATFIRSDAFWNVVGFNVENRTMWDAEFMLDLSLAGRRIERVNAFWGLFTIHEQSIRGSGRLEARVRTVSVVFDDPAFTETRYMESVAERIGSEHIALQLRPDDLLEWLDDAFEAMDQPTFDGINTYVVSRAAADTGLKVALSGLGADELFDGYGYVGRVGALERARRLPRPAARLAAAPTGHLLRGERGDKASAWLRGEDRSSYGLLRRLFLASDVRRLARNAEVPYLDQPLVEWALRQPERVKGRSKALLAAAAADLVPSEVLSGRKHGFVFPLRFWMRGELRKEVEERFRHPPEALAQLIDTHTAAEVWADYLASSRRWLRPWALYAFARWIASLEGAPA